MEKFVGTVNGKTFDNEKDFNAAARAAIKENDGSLSISSYYKSVSDEKEEEKEVETQERDASNDISPNAYCVEENNAPYIISNELNNKLVKATNKSEVLKKAKEKIDDIDNTILEKADEVNDIKAKILELKKTYDEKVGAINDLKLRKKYYNNVINTLQSNTNNYTGRILTTSLSDIIYDIFHTL